MSNHNSSLDYQGPLYAPHPDLIKDQKKAKELREVVELPGVCVETNIKPQIIRD